MEIATLCLFLSLILIRNMQNAHAYDKAKQLFTVVEFIITSRQISLIQRVNEVTLFNPNSS